MALLVLYAGLLALSAVLTSAAQAQVYPVFNFRYHDAYAWDDPAYYPFVHVGGLGVFPELDYVVSPFGSLWFLYSTARPTCNGTCGDARFTGCAGPNAVTWPPFPLGGPVQDSGGAASGAYLTLASSRAFVFAGTQTLCSHVGGVQGQKVEYCDRASGKSDSGWPYFVQFYGELRSKIIYSTNGVTPAEFYVEQSGDFANYQVSPGPAFWISGPSTGTAVKSALYLRAFGDGTARWDGTWSVYYNTLGCRLDFPLQAVAVGQP